MSKTIQKNHQALAGTAGAPLVFLGTALRCRPTALRSQAAEGCEISWKRAAGTNR